MNKQLNEKTAALKQRMLDFLLKRPDDQTYEEAFHWLAVALKTIYSPLPMILSESSNDLQRADVENNQLSAQQLAGQLKESNGCFSLRTDDGETIPSGLLSLIESFLNNCYHHEKTNKENNRQKQMFVLTELFHSLMQKEDVLKALVEKLKHIFPDLSFLLLISHDQDQNIKIPARVLSFEDDETNSVALDAYLSGEIKYEDQSSAYLPIKGLQGIYGVLYVNTGNGTAFADEMISSILIVTEAAGKAFENARLYEQSQTIIKNLRLINETSHQLNKTLRLSETMKDLSKRMIDYFDADEVGFFYIDHLGETKGLPGSSFFFQTKAAQPYVQFVSNKLSEEHNGVFVGNGKAVFGKNGYGSMMSVPMIENSKFRGYAIALKRQVYAFTFDMFKLFQSLIHHSTLAVTNSMLRDKLEYLVKTDKLTELYSRSYLEEKINYSMKYDNSGTFILIDIDNFKKINDTYGHQTGDNILIQVAGVIHENIRDHDVGARWGGEELAIYLPHAELPTGIKVAKRLIQAVRKSTNPAVTISVGVSYWSEELMKPLQTLFQQADEALYTAKRNGKNKMVVFDQYEEKA
ncbi:MULTISPECIES: sensor domain-containing diguanylate cyclase [Bacillus]|uniref:GGDEF domain-containing protein n=2 Tax=Bacillus TaxID=1386 RepID=A0A0M3R9U2_9BACI|nr:MULTISPECIES: GGDEF domain-containing protein [Bacillus]ALC82032.1 hypothetical protein AM592_10765 [Bacillus gobiensis]MBP1083376.1 diguanylate cyclase (GGDEF)-like protein [Bacillus capparidis]MED1097808.1 GGDEF domain-containing protein [Bacillus capparidis]